MPAPVYLGDEVSGAGWRLAGAEVHTPAPGAATEALASACARAPLVLVSADVALAIAVPALQKALLALAPLVLVVPDLQGQAPLPDLAGRLRTQLGLEA
ncbi:MAG: hypothetical protein Q8K45_17920 [Rubrivivax sp.]|nr:hypothetical protein [Rubrivivax sp.]